MGELRLRDYQQKAVDMVWSWIRENHGHVYIDLPTGAGKSVVTAQLCLDVVKTWGGRVLMLTHVKELVGQNAEKMRQIWPGAPLGVYSAGLNRRELGEPITFAGIQSAWRIADKIGHIDITIVDECHLINHENEGMYRNLINDLTDINPRMRVLGLTATPFRIGHGRLEDGDGIFSAGLQPTSIEELIGREFLAPLRSKPSDIEYDLSRVKRSGGDYVVRDLESAVDTEEQNDAIVRDVIARAGDRKAWLFFCTSVEHSYHVRDKLRELGVSCETVVGETPEKERDDILIRYKRGEIKALTSMGVLTTGFDYPNIDLIAALRPTLSVVLYIQMAGRGMRLKDHTDHCLFLDYGKLVGTHGPITSPITPEKAGKGGKAPTKTCPECNELCAPRDRVCPDCGYQWPEPEMKAKRLHTDDIMGNEPNHIDVTEWRWRKHVKAETGQEMLRVDYFGTLDQPMVSEWICVKHGGLTGMRAMRTMNIIAQCAGFALPEIGDDLDAASERLNKLRPPAMVEYKPRGKFFDVTARIWTRDEYHTEDDEIPF